ncbi:hypothetical protein [Streptomyces sp. NBC_00096]|uniref:hypothetical protein n=1 Tax=Streptomyces sp. NBC_00096 TaxID=2975650 RepID=UPI00324A4F01
MFPTSAPGHPADFGPESLTTALRPAARLEPAPHAPAPGHGLPYGQAPAPALVSVPPVYVPPVYVPAPVPAPATVSTPVYDEMVAEWAAFGRHWPGADWYADVPVPGTDHHASVDWRSGTHVPPSGPWT